MRLRGQILRQERTTAPCWVLGGGSKDIALVTTAPLSFSKKGAGGPPVGSCHGPQLTLSGCELGRGIGGRAVMQPGAPVRHRLPGLAGAALECVLK